MKIHQALVNERPAFARYRSDLAWCWRYLCLAKVAAGDSSAALELVERAAAVHEELVATDSGDVEFRWRLARCLDEVGRIRSRSKRPADGAKPLQRSAELYATVTRLNPVLYRLDVARNQLNLAFHSAVTGRPHVAIKFIRTAEDLMHRSSTVWPVLYYDLACAYSLSSATNSDGSLTPAMREECTRKAVAALRTAARAGYCSLEQIRRDACLAPLHAADDYQALIMDLSFPAHPFQR
jgi:hypothetical protein